MKHTNLRTQSACDPDWYGSGVVEQTHLLSIETIYIYIIQENRFLTTFDNITACSGLAHGI